MKSLHQTPFFGVALLIIQLLIVTGSATSEGRAEAFHEQLFLKPLVGGRVYTHFQFTTHLQMNAGGTGPINLNDTPFSQFNMFPRSIGQVLQAFEVHELHLTFTQGRWQYEDDGYPLAPSAGTGVELWAWLNDNQKTDANWKGLTNTLSGLFCASLNFIDSTLTVEPKMSFNNEGIYNVHSRAKVGSQTNRTSESSSTNKAKLRYGSLPHENVCTENLTPWIKLLPCKSKAGIALLLKSHRLFDTQFYSMAIHVQPVCEDEACLVKRLELVQSISTVFDVSRSNHQHDWSLVSLFERDISGACPVATSSKIIVDYEKGILTPTPSASAASSANNNDGRRHAVYDLHALKNVLTNDRPFELAMKAEPAVLAGRTDQVLPGIVAHRYFTGYGQERGGISVEIANNLDSQVEAIYFDTLPWFLKVYLHTFQIKLDQSKVENQKDIAKKMYYQPAIDRGRPAVLEVALTLPPRSGIKISLDFDKVFLNYTEHHPDANRGFDIGAAVVTAFLPKGYGQIGYSGLDHSRTFQGRNDVLNQNGVKQEDDRVLEGVRIYTETLLVSLPTPDFSMPYNVITLTCTVIALFFGSIFNLLTRNFEVIMPKASKDGKDNVVGKEK